MPTRSEVSRSLALDDYPGLGRYLWHPRTGALQWSPGLKEIYGRSEAPRNEAEFMACLHPDDRVRVEGETEAFLASDAESYSHSFRVLRPDGEVRYVLDRARIDRDAQGRVTEIHGINMDVTDVPHLSRSSMDDESKVMETAKAELPRAFRDHDRLELGQRTGDLVVADIDYRAGTVRLNAAAARLYGLGDETMVVPREALHATFHPDDADALEALIAASLDPSAGGKLQTEHRVRHPDGSVRWLRVRKRIEFATIDGRRQPDRGILAAIDISKRKQAEIDLRESNKRLALAQQVAGIGVWDVDLAQGKTVWTSSMYDLFGIDPATPASPEALFERVHPDDVARLRNAFETSIAAPAPFEAEFRIVLPGGDIRHMIGQGGVTEVQDGKTARILGVNYDITDRRLAEAALRESEARLRTILDETVALVGILDVDGTLREANSVALRAGGLRREEVVGKPFWEAGWWTHDQEEVARLKQAVAEAAAGHAVRYDAQVAAADGSLRTIDFSLSPVFDEAGMVSLLVPSALDITERKRAEARLAERENQLALLAAHAPAAIAMFDCDLRYIAYSRRYMMDYGLASKGDLTGRSHYEVLPEIPQRWREIHQRVLSGETLAADEDPFPRADGKTDYVRWTMSPWHSQNGEPGGAILFSEVITEQVKARRALRESEARYRALFESINAGFCVIEVDLDGAGGRTDYRVIEANPAFYDRTGFPKDILGQWLRTAVPDLEEHWYEIYGGVARTGESARFEDHSEMLGRWFDVFAFRIDEPEECRVAILFHDISDRKRHEDHVGTLLKEVNHRAKNMLALVNVIARRTASQGLDGFIDRFSERISALATNQDILVRSDWQHIPLAELVRSQLSHFEDLIDNRIDIAGPEVALVPEAAEKLGMAMHELATNAAKYGALSNETGRILIRWDIIGDQPDQFAMTWQEMSGPKVVPPERNGFGSLVSGELLATSLDGKVEADYRADGLRWHFTCPQNAISNATRASAPPANDATEAGSAPAVLIVEDDALLGMSLAETLTGAGIAVIGPARSSDAALGLIQSRPPTFAILDVNLGGETSERVATELKSLGVPFVAISGYSSQQLPEAFRSAPFLPKPVQDSALVALLERASPRHVR